MFNLAIDVALSRGLLRELVDDTEAEISSHQSITPGFTPEEAGRDFRAHGEALDRVFAAVHERNLELMRRTVALSTAAHAEITGMASADVTTKNRLMGVEEQAWAN